VERCPLYLNPGYAPVQDNVINGEHSGTW